MDMQEALAEILTELRELRELIEELKNSTTYQ